MDGLKSRMERTEKRINVFEDKVIEIPCLNYREKTGLKNEQSLRNLWN